MTLPERVLEAGRAVLAAERDSLTRTLGAFVSTFVGRPYLAGPATLEGVGGRQSAPFACVVFTTGEGASAVPAGAPMPITAMRNISKQEVGPFVRDTGETPNNYGLSFWTHNGEPGVPTDLFMSRGHNLNHSYVIPSLDLVVVRQGNDNRRVAGDQPFATAVIQKVVAAIG